MPDLTLPAAADAHKLFKIQTVSMAMDQEAADLDQDLAAVVTAQGHEGLLTHFQPALEPPSVFPKIPGLSPMRWMVAREYPECFLAVKQDGKLFSEMFYCAGCRCWKKISSTFHHVRAHFTISIPSAANSLFLRRKTNRYERLSFTSLQFRDYLSLPLIHLIFKTCAQGFLTGSL